ncbi:hypothetical protein EVAR_29676_1 [Eumeta japonica]|uniref:Uncharacterized protein n=1 Tax=Eumeta variegata TaxID=151549 RepID=A0A4C1W7T4_EUMVA|nr:hypothetical protein EVAR_29676_1 [Eumeta japonica]
MQKVTSSRVAEVLKLPTDALPTTSFDVQSYSEWYVKEIQYLSILSNQYSIRWKNRFDDQRWAAPLLPKLNDAIVSRGLEVLIGLHVKPSVVGRSLAAQNRTGLL